MTPTSMSLGVTASPAVNGTDAVKLNGVNTMSEKTTPKKQYVLKKIYNTLECHEFGCEREHNDDGSPYSTGHHYGCLCQRCSTYYYLRLK
jgi:hypothetical protein